jgi:hypothetical protein
MLCRIKSYAHQAAKHGVLKRPKLRGFLLAASAVLLFSGAARAQGGTLLALNKPARAAVNSDTRQQAVLPAALKEPATAQIGTEVAGYTDFDAFTSANDPLYREGAKELLKQAVKTDAGRKNAPAGVLRDAPISKEAKPGAVRRIKARGLMKKTRSGKPLHTDPVKVNNTF